MSKKPIADLTGRRFGLLVAVDLGERSPSGRVRWNCACDCGGSALVQASNLLSGNSSSCGCVGRAKSAERMALVGRLPNRQKSDDEIAYTAAHDRVRRVNGSARLHACVDCGRQAQDWSLKPDCPRRRRAGSGKDAHLWISPFPEDYEPRCKKCHCRVDGLGWRRVHEALRARRSA